jgi:hypothetical protein
MEKIFAFHDNYCHCCGKGDAPTFGTIESLGIDTSYDTNNEDERAELGALQHFIDSAKTGESYLWCIDEMAPQYGLLERIHSDTKRKEVTDE